MCLHALKQGLCLRQKLIASEGYRRLLSISELGQLQRSGAFPEFKQRQSFLHGCLSVKALSMPPKAKVAKTEAQGNEPSAVLTEEGKIGKAKKLGARRRDLEAEVQAAGQERSKKRRRSRRIDNVLSAEPANPARLDEEDAEEPAVAVIAPTLKAIEAPLIAEVGQNAEKFLDAVVKVFCVHSEPNYSLPWQRKRQMSSTSSGFIIAGRRILTNAHSVDHHCQVKVRRRGSDTKFLAKVLAQGPECDIALLTVDDDAFWEPGIPPVHFGHLPRLQDSVSVVGFPIGGDTMSVTSGVVSRIEVTSYTHGATALLGMQIDAAINSGNSGGPAFNARVARVFGAGECVGIAFQSLRGEDVENIGYVIPVDVVHHFITDFDLNGRFTSFPILGIEWQKMESPYLRKAMGMKEGQKGILVRRVEPTASSNKVLKKGDILLSFDGVQLANDGTIPFRSGERISFSYLVQLVAAAVQVSKKYTDDTARVELLRNGKKVDSEISLSSVNRLIPEHLDNAPPPYLILAGLVFTQVTSPYLRSEYGKDYDYDSPVKLLDLLLHGKCKFPDQQVVVLGHVLAADCTIGYEDLTNNQVFSVNGKKINKLKDLVDIVDTCKSEYLKFELEYDATVIIDTKVAKAATKDIMAQHGIAHDRSVDLRA